ncbi:hypothetical protein [Mucilaginibacter sp.]|jgi:hypothetical protein|uniref:hypothetical protein n=1 Tax=Mucilaginibacter sp. TaxID=1882438 RepID=UPI0025FA3EA9|nr:hypothetical protein [Mucilaginibacter sp.]
MAAKNIKPQQNDAILTILWLCFLTGTLDGIAAIIWNYFTNGSIHADIIFKFIASGVFGKAAFNGGAEMVLAGVIFHYLIAFLFTAVFYPLYPICDKLLRNKYLIAIFYGVITWLVMNLAVVPLSKIGFHPIKVQVALTGIIILIICIGLPIALIADKKYWASKFTPLK